MEFENLYPLHRRPSYAPLCTDLTRDSTGRTEDHLSPRHHHPVLSRRVEVVVTGTTAPSSSQTLVFPLDPFGVPWVTRHRTPLLLSTLVSMHWTWSFPLVPSSQGFGVLQSEGPLLATGRPYDDSLVHSTYNLNPWAIRNRRTIVVDRNL